MYLDHFKLKEKPFNITPNPQFIFLSKNHKEVFAHLLYGLQSRCGFIEITGEVGTGKTTVLRTLFEQLDDEEFRLGFIFNPSLSAEELLQEICREFGIETKEGKGAQLLTLINNFLLHENAAGRTVVLVVDEAQNLAAPVLEQIRLLSNLETETDKLIQIVLVGQPELAEILGKTNLRQLNQRISVRYHLMPMDESDSASYIDHRLNIAGGENRSLFSEPAKKIIFRQSTGIPRLINILCDRALLAAYSENHEYVDRQDVKTAISELKQVKFDRPVKGMGKGMVMALTLAVTVTALALLAYTYGIPFQATTPPHSVAHSDAPAAIPRLSIEDLRTSLAAMSEDESFTRSARAIMTRWQAEFLDSLGQPFSDRDFAQALSKNGWQWTAFNGSLSRALSFDTPVLLEITLPGISGKRYLAVTGMDGDAVRISPPLAGHGSLLTSELDALYGGRVFIAWKNYLDIGYYSKIGSSASDVREIQSLLKNSGFYSAEQSGIYDSETIRAVTRFQAEQGIAQDGRVGPLTLLLLYHQSGYFNPPRLRQERES